MRENQHLGCCSELPSNGSQQSATACQAELVVAGSGVLST